MLLWREVFIIRQSILISVTGHNYRVIYLSTAFTLKAMKTSMWSYLLKVHVDVFAMSLNIFPCLEKLESISKASLVTVLISVICSCSILQEVLTTMSD